ncbi:MAG: RpiB/LacA/LacB family sugar-phosphate isomerase [Spirochaetota bacterium]
MTIVVGADHGGFQLKESIKQHLIKKGHTVIDIGTTSEESCDYPDIARAAADEKKKKNAELMMLACGTGIGISIAANKIEGVYCALVYNENAARMARLHNDANCLAFGGREVTPDAAIRMIDIFLAEKPSADERHVRRRQKMKAI